VNLLGVLMMNCLFDLRLSRTNLIREFKYLYVLLGMSINCLAR
jgi:hypothetical protein